MTDKDFDRVMTFKVIGNNALLPDNQMAHEYVTNNFGIVAMKDVTTRDLSFHRAYHGLLRFIWLHLPKKFQKAVPQSSFYQWLKHLQGKYKVKYEFLDGTKWVEYESTSFGRMSQDRFKEYVREQLPVIYDDVIRKMYDDEASNILIEIIETEWEGYLDRL